MGDLAAYAGLFAAAFVAATTLPMQSEAVLVGLLLTGGHSAVLLVAGAGIGSVLERFRDRKWSPVSPERLERAGR